MGLLRRQGGLWSSVYMILLPLDGLSVFESGPHLLIANIVATVLSHSERDFLTVHWHFPSTWTFNRLLHEASLGEH